MGTLNPDLLSKDMDEVINKAIELRQKYSHQAVQPELILLALLQQPNTAAARLMNVFTTTRGVDLQKLERQVELAAQSRRDQNGNLDFVGRGNKKIPLSRQTIIMLDEALSVANATHEGRVDTDHALTVLSESTMASTSGLLRQAGITPKAIKDILSDSSQVIGVRANATAVDVVKQQVSGHIRPVYYREDLLRDMINILTQSSNRHIILIGPDGVGKRTLGYSLAQVMAQGKGPSGLSNLVQIDETALLDNDQQAVRAGLSKAFNGILFIPHIHRFFGGPIKAEFSKATPIIQKAFLDDNPVIICTTTETEYNQRLASVSAITENAQILRVPEPSIEQTVEILKILKPQIQSDYDIEIQDESLKIAANFAKRYLTTMPLPRSAEVLIHRAAAMVNMSKQPNLIYKPIMSDGVLDPEDVKQTISQMTGIPATALGEDERARYGSMVEKLKERLVGQDEAVMVVSRAIKAARMGLKDARKPVGAFLFLGPTGVGKTELARTLAEFLFGSENAMLPLDMSEFMEESSVNRLTGSSTGYVGSEEGGQLTEWVKQKPYSIVLFDEIEKANDRIPKLLLQVMDEGRLTDGRGNQVNFSETVIIFTSNLGARHLAVPVLTDDNKEAAMGDVRSHFAPEFLNRLDEIVMFNALSSENLASIMRMMIRKEAGLLEDQRGIKLTIADSGIKWLIEQNNEPEYGARPLKRIIRRFLREPLADFLITSNPPSGTEVKIGTAAKKKGGGLKFSAVINGQEVAVES